ncbi:MAG: cellulase family glycosylhydrolase [Chloroflexota bacterium]|nr:cellulase family glycosylhydrolase [Chloroflexota bacterium]
MSVATIGHPCARRSWLILWASLLVLTPLVALGPSQEAHAATSLTGLRVVGNQLVNSSGQAVRLLGVNRSGTQYACVEGGGVFDGPVDDAAINAMVAWGMNAVRVSLNEHCWLGINGSPAATSGATYQNAIADFVARLNAHGMAVILDLHWNAPGTQLARGQQAMADRDHSPEFWRQVAARFKDNGAVLFDLYNEPHPDFERDTTEAWRCWRDGGTCAGVSFQVAGMQELVNAVRSTGATNIVMATGVVWGNHLTRWLEYRPSDPAGNLAAGWHSYHDGLSECDDSTSACLDAKLGAVAQQFPLVATEIGQFDCRHDHIEAVMSWLDAHGQSYTAWSWMPSGCTAEPALITDWNGTPTQTYGQGFRDHLARVGGTVPALPPTTDPGAPTAPSNLAATQTGSPKRQVVDLRWTDTASTEAGFVIERSTTAGFTGNIVGYRAAANATSYRDTAVGRRTTYYYRVAAVGATGVRSAWSNVATVITR